jgi:hypothetical protein
MKVRSFIDLKKKYKTGALRWLVIELYRLELVSQSQILAEPRSGPFNISLNSLRSRNRDYQRYRLRRYYPKSKYLRKMKTEADEITRFKLQLAQTETLLQQEKEKLKREALDIMINIAEKEFKIPIRNKSAAPISMV